MVRDEFFTHHTPRWREWGVKEIGVAINLSTTSLDIPEGADIVLCMSIRNIGTQGSSFDSEVLNRIVRLSDYYQGDKIIAVDGGISLYNIETLVQAGARRFYVGSSIMKTPDPTDSYGQLLGRANSALQYIV